MLGFAGSNDHQAVSKFIVDHFAQYNIHAVQFIGMVAKVTFAAEASKQQLLSHQAININGILCAVRGDGPHAQNVLVYNLLAMFADDSKCYKVIYQESDFVNLQRDLDALSTWSVMSFSFSLLNALICVFLENAIVRHATIRLMALVWR